MFEGLEVCDEKDVGKGAGQSSRLRSFVFILNPSLLDPVFCSLIDLFNVYFRFFDIFTLTTFSTLVAR